VSAIIEILIAQAEWREHKAEEYPDDERNLRAASALRAAAEYVGVLPDDDQRLRVIDATDVDHPGGERTHEVLRRVGFHHTLPGGRYPESLDEPSAILDQLAEAIEDDEAERLRDEIDSTDDT